MHPIPWGKVKICIYIMLFEFHYNYKTPTSREYISGQKTHKSQPIRGRGGVGLDIDGCNTAIQHLEFHTYVHITTTIICIHCKMQSMKFILRILQCNCTLFSIQHTCYFMEYKVHFCSLIFSRKILYSNNEMNHPPVLFYLSGGWETGNFLELPYHITEV